MKISLFVLGVSFLVPSIAANVVSVDVVKKATSTHGSMSKRGMGAIHPLDYSEAKWSYEVQVEVGTPPQTLSLTLDTGSSDTWVMSKSGCNQCESSFDPNLSNTYQALNGSGFKIDYVSGSATGTNFKDTFGIAGMQIPKMQMGLATEDIQILTSGIIGLSYKNGESSNIHYPTLLDNMVSDGMINTPAFSLVTDKGGFPISGEGTIIFGGIDTEQFVGDLLSTPIFPVLSVNSTWNYEAFFTNMTYLGLNGNMEAFDASYVILDCGSSLIYLPDRFIAPIAHMYNASYSDTAGMYTMDCALQSEHANDYIEFEFARVGNNPPPTIRIPLSALIMQNNPTDSPAPPGTCYFGLFPGDTGLGLGDTSLLGDLFLQHAYAVYDLKNNEIGLAQSYFDSTTSNIVEIEADATTIPVICGRNDASCSSGTKTNNKQSDPVSSTQSGLASSTQSVTASNMQGGLASNTQSDTASNTQNGTASNTQIGTASNMQSGPASNNTQSDPASNNTQSGSASNNTQSGPASNNTQSGLASSRQSGTASTAQSGTASTALSRPVNSQTAPVELKSIAFEVQIPGLEILGPLAVVAFGFLFFL